MKRHRLIYILAAAALASCSDEDFRTGDDGASATIAFSQGTRSARSGEAETGYAGGGVLLTEDGRDTLYVAAMSDEWGAAEDNESRANTGVTATQAADITDFYATCVRRDASGTPTDYYFHDKNYEKSGDIFQLPGGNAYYWAGTKDEDYDFYTFSSKPSGMTATYASPNAPKLTYTVGNDNQEDIVTAKYLGAPANWGQVVPLTFKHIMTAIRFKSASEVLPGQITKIELKGVGSKGDYTFTNSLGEEEEWTMSGETANYSVEPNVTINGGTTVTPSEYIGTFVLLPQTLGAGAEIAVTFKDSYTNTEFALTMSLEGHVWPMGRVLTYIISTKQIISENILTVTPSTEETTYDGGTLDFAVASRVRLQDEEGNWGTYAAGWTAKVGSYAGNKFTEGTGDEYAWLDVSGLTGSGTTSGTEAKEATAKYIRGTVKSGDTHLAALQASTTANGTTESTPYNLANATGASPNENTANCYIVDGAGWYSFPLVYGNSIKNSAVNANAFSYESPLSDDWGSTYRTANGAGGYLSAFVNGASTGSTTPSPTISTTNYYITNGTKAALVWSNEENVITDVKIDNTNKRVTFHVSADKITQNNAVIAVYKESTVLWSWHIWITDRGKKANDIGVTSNGWYQYSSGSGTWSEDNTLNTETELNTSYKFMDVPMGYRDECQLVYPTREAWIEFEQTDTGKKVYVKVTQTGKSETTRPAQTLYYQFGRKDPFTQFISNTKSGEDEDLLPFYYKALPSGLTKHVQSASNTYTYTDYNNNPDIYYYGNAYPRFWNAWNNSRSIPTWGGESDQYYIYNYLSNYFINDPSRVVKTVYDPSPVGYTVMSGQSVSGFTAIGLTAGTNSSEWPSYQTCVWSGDSKNINCTETSEPSTSFGTAIHFYTSPMTEQGTTGGGSTIEFQHLGRLNAQTGTFKETDGYYWTANKERNITKASGTSLSINDSYQSGCMFSFGKTLSDNSSLYDMTVRTRTAFGVRACCPVRCTEE